REAEASMAQFQAILAIPPELRPANPLSPLPLAFLGFEGVTFTHHTAAAPALVDVTFSVRTGETVAFVGPSGSGKTTLVKLLVGLYHPQAGRILYNGHPSEVVDLDSLRERIGLVTQDTQLFSGTTREHLLFVSPEAT